MHAMEMILSVECEIPSLKLAIEFLSDTYELEEDSVHLENLDEHRQDVVVSLETNKHCVKDQCDKCVHPCLFNEDELVLLYDQ